MLTEPIAGVCRRVATLLSAVGLCVVSFAALGSAQAKVTLRGVVTDPIGGTMSSATVTLYSPDEIRGTQSADDGSFRFEGLRPGRYTIEVQLPGLRREVLEGVEVPQPSGKPLAIELQIADTADHCFRNFTFLYVKENPHARSLAGTVEISFGRGPIAGARLALFRLNDPSMVAERTSNEKGEFEFPLLPPGRYVLRASGKDYGEQTSSTFYIARRTLTRVKFSLMKAGEVFICE